MAFPLASLLGSILAGLLALYGLGQPWWVCAALVAAIFTAGGWKFLAKFFERLREDIRSVQLV